MVTTDNRCAISGTFCNAILDCNLTSIDTQSTASEDWAHLTGRTVPLAQQCPSPATESCSDGSQRVNANGREDAKPTISPTQEWTNPCVEIEEPPYSWPKSMLLPAKDVLSDFDLLAAFRDTPMAELGADMGVTLVYRSQRARLQIMQAPASQLVSARAYMVQGDCCPTCFCEGHGWECPNCSSPMTQFRLPSHSDFQFSNRVEEQFHRYCSHSLQALQFTGPVTIHFRVIACHGSGVFEAATTEGRRVWVILHPWYDDIVSPATGEEYCLFQGLCCGSVGLAPVFHVPPPSLNNVLVRRPAGDTAPRILEMFAGIGGWGQAIKALSPSGVPIFSVEVEPNVATALAVTTKRPLIDVDRFLQGKCSFDCRCHGSTLVDHHPGVPVFRPRLVYAMSTLVTGGKRTRS